MLRYVIVGSGYRAEYFGRIAKTYPDLFSALYPCRSEEKADLIKRHTGVDAVTDADACLAFRPDFVVIAVETSKSLGLDGSKTRWGNVPSGKGGGL